MKLIAAILSLAMLAASGCGDPVGAVADRFWSGRGRVFYTDGLALENPGTVAAINVDGSGRGALFTGVIPCPPRGGKILYADATLNKNDWAIYLADTNGTGAREVVSGSGIEKPILGILDLSPSASKVLYVVYNMFDKRSTLHVANVDRSAQTQLSDKVVSSTVAAFSHDERWVAFYAGAGKNELTVIDPAVGAPVVVAYNARPWSIENLDWSPDGMIAYVGAADMQGSSARNIYVVDPDSGGPTPLTFDTAEDNRWPVWSPDGSMIAYIHGNELWTMSADGSNKRRITRQSEWPYQIKMFPQWSADQTMILFTAVAGNGVQGLLQVVDLRTLRVNALATGAARGFWR